MLSTSQKFLACPASAADALVSISGGDNGAFILFTCWDNEAIILFTCWDNEAFYLERIVGCYIYTVGMMV